MECVTDKLNVLTNVLDVPTDLVRTKCGGEIPPLPSPLGYGSVVQFTGIISIINMDLVAQLQAMVFLAQLVEHRSRFAWSSVGFPCEDLRVEFFETGTH